MASDIFEANGVLITATFAGGAPKLQINTTRHEGWALIDRADAAKLVGTLERWLAETTLAEVQQEVAKGDKEKHVAEQTQWTVESVDKHLIAIVGDQLGISEHEIHPESSFIEDLGADSLDIVELTMAVEEEFEFRDPIPDEDVEKMKTFNDVSIYVKRQLKLVSTETAA